MADDKDANSFMLLYFLTPKQHKKRTVWVRRWLLDIATPCADMYPAVRVVPTAHQCTRPLHCDWCAVIRPGSQRARRLTCSRAGHIK